MPDPGAIATGFLGALSHAEREDLAARGRTRAYARGTRLFRAGAASDSIVVVLSGRVKVASPAGGDREAVLAFRGPGDLLGELSALDGLPRSATVSAVEPVEALVVEARRFRAFLEQHPRLALLLLATLSRRLRDADRKRVEFAAHDSVGRVAARLVELAREHGEAGGAGVQITLPISQDELAGWTGSSREAVAKALHTLRSLGWVRTGRRRITVVDLEALRARST
jgi:CRP/FNR family transcriptional regulator, cyclic AMP receptor protein